MARNLKQLRKKLDDVMERIKDIEDDFEYKVQEHPVQSVAIAFGAGMLSGALLHAIMRSRK